MKKEDLPKILPVFPLSNFIIFPRTTVPSNIFEPRYIQMIDQSMKTNRLIGIIQPKKSGLVDFSFGAALGILRGYIIFVLIIFFTDNYLSQNITPDFLSKGSFQDIINYGVKILDQMPRNLENFSSLDT